MEDPSVPIMNQPEILVHQSASEQIISSVHDASSSSVTTLPSIIADNVESISSTLAPEIVRVEQVVTETVASFAAEGGDQIGNIVVDTIEPSIVSNVAEQLSNIVEPILNSDLPVPPVEPQVDMPQVSSFLETEMNVESISDSVTEMVTEVAQEVTTLLSSSPSESDSNIPLVSSSPAPSPSLPLTPQTLLTTEYIQWLHETRLILAFSVSLVYLFTIFFIRRLLSKRSPFDLRNLLTLWNTGLALFSMACSAILAKHLLQWTKENGLGSTLCSIPLTDSTRLWLNLFTWSKLFELGNTLFVVLRKQKLRFPHVYYHLSTLIYGFYLFGGGFMASGDNASTPSYYQAIVFINVAVQSIIYTYYIFRSRGCSTPRILTCTLNLINLIQFMIMLFILSVSLYYHVASSYSNTNLELPSIPLPASLANLTLPPSLTSITKLTSPCSPSMATDIFGLILIGTNFILFANQFRSNYVKPKTIKLL